MTQHSEQTRAAIPLGESEIRLAAAARGLAIPPECVEGVAANLALLARHANVLRGEER